MAMVTTSSWYLSGFRIVDYPELDERLCIDRPTGLGCSVHKLTETLGCKLISAQRQQYSLVVHACNLANHRSPSSGSSYAMNRENRFDVNNRSGVLDVQR